MKMTEKEFLGRIAEAMKDRGYAFTPMARAATQQAIAEAGLEFAPEPVGLPERLGVDHRGFIQPQDRLHAGMFGWVDEEQRVAGNQAAADRYNAYPGLRRAANSLLVALGESRGRKVEDSAASLGLELAKGPK